MCRQTDLQCILQTTWYEIHTDVHRKSAASKRRALWKYGMHKTHARHLVKTFTPKNRLVKRKWRSSSRTLWLLHVMQPKSTPTKRKGIILTGKERNSKDNTRKEKRYNTYKAEAQFLSDPPNPPRHACPVSLAFSALSTFSPIVSIAAPLRRACMVHQTISDNSLSFSCAISPLQFYWGEPAWSTKQSATSPCPFLAQSIHYNFTEASLHRQRDSQRGLIIYLYVMRDHRSFQIQMRRACMIDQIRP